MLFWHLTEPPLQAAHRTAEVSRDIYRLPFWVPRLQAGEPQQVIQDKVQSGFAHLQGWRLHNLSLWLFLVFDHPHSKMSFFFFSPHLYLSGISFCLFSFHWALAPSFLFPPTLVYSTLIRSLWASSSPGWIFPALWASPRTMDAPILSSSSQPFAATTLAHPGPQLLL